MKTKLFPLIAFLFITFTGYTQQTDTIPNKVWTLKECVDYALMNNLQVKSSELNVETNEVNFSQARMNLLPNANASGSMGYNWGRGLDPVSNHFVSSQRNSVGSVGLNGSVTLFNGMRIQNSIKQSHRDLSASEQDLTKARNDLALNIVNLFLNVVFNKELVENARFQLASTQQQLDRTKKQVAAGALARSEELNLEAQVATNELNLVNQENALTLTLLQLKQAMQIPAGEEFDIQIPEIEPEDLILDQSREEVFEIAKGIMPEIKSSQLQVESSYYAVKASKGNLYPRLSLNGSINTNYSKNAEARFVRDGGYVLSDTPEGFSGLTPETATTPVYFIQPTGEIRDIYKLKDQFNDNLYKSVSLSLTIPIFNNNSARASLQRSIISNAQAKINAREVENTLRQNIETAFNDAVAASKSYESSLKQVQARDEAFRITKQRYDIGATNYVDYQVAENNLFQARSDLSRAKYNFIFRKKLLDFFQGKPILY